TPRAGPIPDRGGLPAAHRPWAVEYPCPDSANRLAAVRGLIDRAGRRHESARPGEPNSPLAIWLRCGLTTLDLSGVTFFSSTGIAGLAHARIRAVDQDLTLRVVVPPESVA